MSRIWKRKFVLTVVLILIGFSSAQAEPGGVVVIPLAGDSQLEGYEVVTATTSDNSVAIKSITANCPAGKVAIGGGSRIFGNFGGVGLNSNGPFGSGPKRTSWFGTASEFNDNPNNWSLRVDVVCVNDPD